MPRKKNLRVLVHPDFADEAKETFEDVTVMEDELAYDLILGPNCWRVTSDLAKFCTAIKAAFTNTKLRRAKKK